MRAEELRRQELTEALVGLVRTAGTGSFPRITDKDRVFFRGLAVSGKAPQRNSLPPPGTKSWRCGSG